MRLPLALTLCALAGPALTFGFSLFAAAKFVLNRLSDEYGHLIWPDKRLDAIGHVQRQANKRRLQVHRRAPHAATGIRYRKIRQFALQSDIAY